MKKRIVFILLALFMLGVIFFIYANKILLPVKFKKIAENTLSQHLNREVSIERLKIHLLKGVLLQNILIREKEDRTKVFARLDELSFKILYTPFFKEKTIIIPAVHIQKPYLHLVRTTANNWNFSDMLTPASNNGTQPRLLIRKIQIQDGSIDFRDQAGQFSETLRAVHLTGTAHADKTVHFSLTTHVPIENTFLTASGEYFMETRSLQSRVETKDVPLAEYFLYFFPDSAFQILNGHIIESAFDITYRDKILTLDGRFLTNNLDIQLGSQKRIKGNLQMKHLALTVSEGTVQGAGEIVLPSSEFSIDAETHMFGSVRGLLNQIVLQKDKATLQGDIFIQNMKTVLSDQAEIKGDAQFLKTTLHYMPGEIQMQSQFELNKGSVHIQKTHQASFDHIKHPFQLVWNDDQLNITSSMDISQLSYHFPKGTWQAQSLKNTNLTLSTKPDEVTLNSDIQSTAGRLMLSSGITFTDDTTMNVRYTFQPAQVNPHQLDAHLQLQNGRLHHIPEIKEAFHIKGPLHILNETLTTSGLNFESVNAKWHLSGQLTLKKDPLLQAELTTDHVFLEHLTPFFKNQLEQYAISLSGPTALKISYAGSLQNISPSRLKAHASLKEVSIAHPRLPQPFSHLNGHLVFEKDLVSWKNLKGLWLNEPFQMNGAVENFSRPVFTNSLQSDKLNFSARANILRTMLQITSLKGHLFQSEFDLNGDVFLNEGMSLFIKGKAFLDTKDLPSLLPQHQKTWNRLKLDGILTSSLTFRGHPEKWREWSLSLEANTPVLKIGDVQLKDFYLNYGQRDRMISDANIRANLYGGKLVMANSFNLSGENILITHKTDIYNARLKEFAATSHHHKKLKGTLNAAAVLQGSILEPATLTGEGQISVTNGELYQLNVLQGLKSIVLIDEFKHTTFTDGQAGFKIHKKRVHTSNMTLFSPTIDLAGKGWIDFDGNIQMNVVPKFSELALMRSESLRKGPTALLTHSMNINITGNIQKPQYKVDSLPLNIIKDAPNIIKQGIGAILDEVF